MMTAILKSIHKWEIFFDKHAEKLVFRHPYIAYFAIFIGMPVLMLMAVAICTILAVSPFAMIFGWY